MVRGQPDFGMYAPETYIAGLSDMAELAVRLGSINRSDRRGRVIDFDDFEGPLLKWHIVNVGDAYSIFSSLSAKSGTQSILMCVGGAGDTPTYIARGTTLVGSKRIGVEIAYTFPSSTAHLILQLTYTDDVIVYDAQIKLDFATRKVSYMDEDEHFQEIADIPVPSGWKFLYYPIKFVVDFETGKYVRLMYGGVEYDLSAYNIHSDDPGAIPAIGFYIHWIRIGGALSNIWVDDYILTMEEP